MANFEETFMEGLGKVSGVLLGIADQLDDLTKTFNANGEEVAGLNAGKTESDIKAEDLLAAMISAPIVEALDGMSGILDNATMKIREMTAANFNGK